MRVNVTYSVELEDVPQTTAKLIHDTKENSLGSLTKMLDEALTFLNKEDEKNAVNRLDEVRQELSRIDLRLADCMHILSGYQNVLLGNTEGLENLEEPEEASEVPNEEG
jgi:paraquat-inducible protein B